MWKLGLWPCDSFSGNICFEFSVLVLCSASIELNGIRVRGVLGNKCAGHHNLKTVEITDIMRK
jgi:hypothetical protein